MNKIGYLILTIISISLVSGCDDDDKPQNWTRYEYLNEARDYIYFKTGTWWVYKKIPGGDLDTIEVFEDWIDTLKLTGAGNVMYYEDVTWRAKSRLDDYVYRFYQVFPMPVLEWDLIQPNDKVWKQYFWSKSRPGDGGGRTNVFTYPFTKEILNNGHSHDTKLLDDIDTLTIQGKLFTDLKHYNISNDASFSWGLPGQGGGIVEYYWAPRYGIVKREHMQKNISWELVESHIVQ